MSIRHIISRGIGKVRAVRWKGHLHLDVRQSIIRSQLAQAGQGAIIVIGDSRVEAALLPSAISGHLVVNAGIGSATVGLLYRVVPNLVKDSQFSCAIISVGINNAKVIGVAENFEELFEGLSESISAVSSRVILTTIAPVLKIAPLGVGYYDPTKIGACNEIIKRVARRHSYEIVDFGKMVSHSDDNLRQGFSIDGVHFTPTGYRIWSDILLQAVKSSHDHMRPNPRDA
jgi:lysophospholipase L1-like esterase